MDKASGTFDLHGFCLLVATACHFLATSCLLYADTVPLGNSCSLEKIKAYFVVMVHAFNHIKVNFMLTELCSASLTHFRENHVTYFLTNRTYTHLYSEVVTTLEWFGEGGGGGKRVTWYSTLLLCVYSAFALIVAC